MTPPLSLKHLCLLLAICSSISTATAQLTAYTAFYRQNWQLVNPAAIDRWQFMANRNNSTLLVTGGVRQQWMLAGVEGAPKTYFASFESAPDANKLGVNQRIKYGFSTFWDQTDAFSMGGVFFNFSYYIQVQRGDFLHLGLSGGFVQRRINADKLRFAATQEESLESLGIDGTRINPDFSLGVFYRKKLPNQNRLYAGFSIPQVFNRYANDFSKSFLDKGTPIYLLLGGFIDGGNAYYSGITFEPSLWLRHASGVGFYSISSGKWQYFSMDADLRVYFGDKFWLGGGYGTNQNGMLESGLIVEMEEDKRFRFGFAWNFPAGKSYLNLGHSFELTTSFGVE